MTDGSSNKRELLTRWSYHLICAATTVWFVLLQMPPMHLVVIDSGFGNQLSKALEILSNRHPFAEIMNAVYGPLVFYTSAIGQSISGKTMLGEMTLITASLIIAYVLFAKIAHQLTRATVPAFLIVLLALVLMPRPFKYYIVLCPMMHALVLYQITTATITTRLVFLLALTTTITGLFRLDYGAYAAAASIVALLWKRKDDGSLCIWRRSVFYFAFAFLLVLPWLVFLSTRINPAEALLNTLRMTAASATGMATSAARESTTYTIFHWTTGLLPLIAVVVAILKRHDANDRSARTIVPLAVLSAGIFLQATHRVSVSHLLQVLPVALLVFAWLVGQLWNTRTAYTYATKCGALAAIALLVWFSWPQIEMAHRRTNARAWSDISAKFASYNVTSQQWRDKTINPKRAQEFMSQQVCTRVCQLTDPDDPVLFLPYAPQLYWFADRIFHTQFGWLNPGRFRDSTDEMTFIESLASTKLIVDEPAFQFIGVQTPDAQDYAPRVMQHVYSHYAVVDAIGPYLLRSTDPDQINSQWKAPRPYPFEIPEAVDPSDHDYSIFINGRTPQEDNLSLAPRSGAVIEIQYADAFDATLYQLLLITDEQVLLIEPSNASDKANNLRYTLAPPASPGSYMLQLHHHDGVHRTCIQLNQSITWPDDPRQKP